MLRLELTPRAAKMVLVILLQHHDSYISRCSVDNAISSNCAESYTTELFSVSSYHATLYL